MKVRIPRASFPSHVSLPDICSLALKSREECYAAEIPEDKKRISVKGWNELEDGYAFRYEDPTGQSEQGPCLRHYPATGPSLLLS